MSPLRSEVPAKRVVTAAGEATEPGLLLGLAEPVLGYVARGGVVRSPKLREQRDFARSRIAWRGRYRSPFVRVWTAASPTHSPFCRTQRASESPRAASAPPTRLVHRPRRARSVHGTEVRRSRVG